MSEALLHLVFATAGGLGAVARHAITGLVIHRFPWSTMIVNVTGSLVLGMAVALVTGDGSGFPEEARRFLFGFCGGFTTFSSFAWQSLDLHREQTLLHAAGYVAFSLVLCLLAYAAGLAMF